LYVFVIPQELLMRHIAFIVAFLIAATLYAAGLGSDDYLQGLDSLANKRWKDAAAAFGKAAQADDENANYHAAYAIASMMSGDTQTAQSEFDRSMRLDPQNQTTRLWAAAFYRMIGNATHAGQIYSTSDYEGTVQEAADRINELRYQKFPPQEVQERHNTLINFALNYAKQIEGSNPDLAKIVWARAQKEFDAGQLEAAQEDDGEAMQAFPADPAPHLLMAKIQFARGQFSSARWALTSELTSKTDDGAAYATRAIVQAHLGNLAAAKADMEFAHKYDPDAAASMQGKYDEVVRSYAADPAAASIDSLWTALQKSVEANESFDQQVAAATDLIKAEFSHRLFWDEWYQDQLRQREDDWRAAPKDPAKIDAIATFLLQENDDPGEQLSPKGPYRAFRDAHPDDEVARAGQMFNDALVINPNDVTAMAGAAEIALRGGQYEDGEKLVRRAMQVDPNNPLILSQLFEILNYAGDVRSGNAMQLRTPETWTTFVPGYVIYHTHYPSQAELDQANQLDQVANQLWTEARDRLAASVQARAGTPEGFYYQGLLDARDQNNDAEINDFQQATKLAPTNGQYRKALIHAYAANNQMDLAAAEQETLTLQRQTTANVRFAEAWNELDRTAYTSMQKDLDDAFAIDPADIRNALYRAVLAQARKDSAESLKWNRVGLAMSEAKLRLDGYSIASDAKTPLPAFAAAMPLAINLRIFSRHRELHQFDPAWETIQQSLAILARVPQKQWSDTFADAVIPNAVNTKANEPPSIETLSAWTHLYAGNALIAMHKYDDALKHFYAGAGKTDQLPAYIAQRPGNGPRWLAQADATRMYWAKNDPDSSHRPQWLASAATFKPFSNEEFTRLQTLQQSIGQTQADDQYWQWQEAGVANLPPDQKERAVQEMERQRQIQRQNIAQSVGANDPPGWPGQNENRQQ
jgi:Tfp pilus assembly protein PilF